MCKTRAVRFPDPFHSAHRFSKKQHNSKTKEGNECALFKITGEKSLLNVFFIVRRCSRDEESQKEKKYCSYHLSKATKKMNS